MEKKSNWTPFLIGALGGVFVIALILAFAGFSEAYNYKSVYILNPEIKCDSLKTAEINALIKLKAEGLLVTPDDYACNIASYYNTFVSFLSILFVVFSFLSFFSIKTSSKKEITLALKDMMKDSIEFKETIISSLLGRIEADYVDKDQFTNNDADLNARIDEINERLQQLERGNNVPPQIE